MTKRSKQLVLLGGSFDPVHHGHLIVARALAEQRGLERIVLVPALSPPHKPSAVASAEHRLAMLQLAVAGEDLLEVSSIELRRGGPSYTYDTLCQVRREYPQAIPQWIIGADMLEDLPRWHRAEEIFDVGRILVVLRPPWHLRQPRKFQGLRRCFKPNLVKQLERSVWVGPLIDISSSEIRRRLEDGRSIRYLTPDIVIRYIERKRLYGPGGRKRLQKKRTKII